jgi:hypothetical protein
LLTGAIASQSLSLYPVNIKPGTHGYVDVAMAPVSKDENCYLFSPPKCGTSNCPLCGLGVSCSYSNDCVDVNKPGDTTCDNTTNYTCGLKSTTSQ